MAEIWYARLDFLTLTVVILTGLDLGVAGLTGFDPLVWACGSFVWIAYLFIGASASWQMSRQRPRVALPTIR